MGQRIIAPDQLADGQTLACSSTHHGAVVHGIQASEVMGTMASGSGSGATSRLQMSAITPYIAYLCSYFFWINKRFFSGNQTPT